MRIKIYNEIHLDSEMEVFQEEHEVDYVTKGEDSYLIYQNDEKEKVILKFRQGELQMTRYSTPKTVMRFLEKEEAIVVLPTPMGLQHLITKTDKLEQKEGRIELAYHLKPLDSDQIFASYEMTIVWE